MLRVGFKWTTVAVVECVMRMMYLKGAKMDE